MPYVHFISSKATCTRTSTFWFWSNQKMCLCADLWIRDFVWLQIIGEVDQQQPGTIFRVIRKTPGCVAIKEPNYFNTVCLEWKLICLIYDNCLNKMYTLATLTWSSCSSRSLHVPRTLTRTNASFCTTDKRGYWHDKACSATPSGFRDVYIIFTS